MARGTTAQRGIEAVANVLRIIGMAIVAVLVVFIVLTLLEANPANGLTTIVTDLANTFSLGLSDLFQPEEPKIGIALNYGIAALLWFVITSIVVRLVRRIG